jgi:penicillin amidase
VFVGMHAHARTAGEITGLALHAPVEIARDERGIPHIRAQNEHDLFFAQGYVEGSDRLFQLDLLRRYVTGRLAEVMGPGAVATDERARNVPIAGIVARQWQRLPGSQRALLEAFSDGVNAAMEREPTPVEFRILLYHPEPWTPQDSLATGMATALDLTDTWNDIVPRERDWIMGRGVGPNTYDASRPLSDACYDAPVTAGLAHVADPVKCVANERVKASSKPPIGSNEWATGAAHAISRRALLANDPHLRLGIPGVWYLIDLEAPGYHAAGATLPGSPGIVLGHNERIAWGATNGTTASLSVFDAPRRLDPNAWQDETFQVRFGKTIHKRYYRAAREFGVEMPDSRFLLVRWNAYDDPHSPVQTFDRLDRAAGIAEALRALRTYPGPTQNFVIADASGRAAYHLAGFIPNDPAWSRYVHPASDLARDFPAVSFTQLPAVAASRDAIVWTANNKMYGPGYPLRLSPEFAPPYRAYRIAQLLRARATYDVGYFARMQMDVLSLPERDLARSIPTLRDWDGSMLPDSREASAAAFVRGVLTNHVNQRLSEVSIASRSGAFCVECAYRQITRESGPLQPWSEAGATQVKHPLAALGIGFLNGTRFPGFGDSFTIHVQSGNFSQSFRAVWDVGNWNAGGISIPQGESGQPGSGHYVDGATDWVAGTLHPFPFSDAAVTRAAVERETLRP